MSRNIVFSSAKSEEDGCLHLMNFKTLKDQKVEVKNVQVKEYLESQFAFDNNQTDKKNLHISFRGRPMNGRKYELPDNYVYSSVTKNNKKKGSPIETCSLGSSAHCWNLDKIPSAADSMPQFVDWLTLNDALHGHVQLEDSK